MLMESLLKIKNGTTEYKEIKNGNDIIWEKAIEKTSPKSESITINNNRSTASGLSYDSVLPSLKAYGGLVKKSLVSDANAEDGYNVLEYIWTKDQAKGQTGVTNVAYIDTEYIPTATTVMEIKLSFNTIPSGGNAFFGASSDGRFVIGMYSGTSTTNFFAGLKNKNLDTGIPIDTAVHTWRLDASANTVSIDGTVVSFESVTGTVAKESLYLFADKVKNYSGANKPADATVYYVKIWENGNLIRDYIPVKYMLTGGNGLYDLIENKFYGSAGSKNFNIGPLLLPVGGIKSSGVEYIDTGIIPTDTIGVKLKIGLTRNSQTDRDSNTHRFGCRQTSSDTRFNIGSKKVSSGSYMWYFGWNKNIDGATVTTLADGATICMNFKNDRNISVNGVICNTTPLPTLASHTRSIILFGRRNESNNIIPTEEMIYGLTITNGSEIIMDLIPVHATDFGYFNHEYCMYDLITHTVFRNQSTGAFTSISDYTCWNAYYTNKVMCNCGMLPVASGGSGHTVRITDGDGNVVSKTVNELLLSDSSYFDLQSGYLYEDHKIKIFDGTENWSIRSHSSTLDKSTYYLSIDDLYSDAGAKAYSNDFDYWSDGRLGCLRVQSGDLLITVNMRLEELKEWFRLRYESGNPVFVVYQTTSPTTEQKTSTPVSLTSKGQKTITSVAEIPVMAQATYLGKD